jgi:localization factor PodJL
LAAEDHQRRSRPKTWLQRILIRFVAGQAPLEDGGFARMPSDESLTPNGLKPEVQDALRDAARRRGVSVSQWLQSVISDSVAAEIAASKPQDKYRPHESSRPEPEADRTSGASSRAYREAPQKSGGRTGASHTAPRSSHRSADAADDLSSALRAIEARLSALDEKHAAAKPAVAKQTVQHRTPPAPRQERNWSRDIGDAIAQIAERQRALDTDDDFDEGPRERVPAHRAAAPAAASAVAQLQDQLDHLTEELRLLRHGGGIEQALNLLRQELAAVSDKLEEAAPRHALQGLQAEVRALAERVDQSRSSDTDADAFADLRRGLTDIRETLYQLAPAESLEELRHEIRALDRKIEGMARASDDLTDQGAELRGLATAVAELREIVSHAATGDALIALAEEVQTIREQFDNLAAPAARKVAEVSDLLEQRFRELEERLETRGESLEAVPGQLVEVVEQLATRLEHVNLEQRLDQDHAVVLDSIAGQITRLTDQIEATHSRIDSLDQFERGFRDLLGGMAELRAHTLEAAEQIARNAALEAAGQAPTIDVDGLRGDLDTLRQTQVQSDRRTQDTLEAVHDTLERLVDRLAMVETRLHASAHTAPRHQSPSPPLAPAVPAQPARDLAPTAPTSLAEPFVPAQAAAPAATRPADKPLLPDEPLEPGTARMAPAASAAERIAASEAALAAVRIEPEPDAKANFIAAARRAAQAAANMAPPAAPAVQSEEKSGSRLGALAQRFSGKRSLLLALLLVVSGGAMHLLLGSSEQKPPTASARMEAPSRPAAVPAPAPPRSANAPSVLAAAPMVAPSALTPAAPPAATASLPPSNPIAASSQARPDPTPQTGNPGQPASLGATTPTVSPLTIASIALPRADVTGSIGRATGIAPAAAPRPAQSISAPEIPANASPALREAALAGDASAEYEIAARYAEGRGVAQNYEAAVRWFERAANRNLAPAQYRLGSLYEKGHGTRKNLDEARRLYRAAADQGNGKAMHNLAVLYAEGIDGKPDMPSAVEWFRQAAVRDVGDSQYNLGILYARGLGVDQNLAESYKWFALAARQGDQDAGKKRDEVATRLDPQALVAARLAVQTFTSERQPESAVAIKTPPGGWDKAAAAAPASEPSARSTPRQRNQRRGQSPS